MAVQAQYLAHAFTHDSRAISSALDNATTAPVFLLREPAAVGHMLPTAAQAVGGNTVFSDPRIDLTCNNNNHGSDSFVPRKRARVGDAVGARLIMEAGHRALLPLDVQRRVLCSGAASTSGRPVGPSPVSQGLMSHLYRHSVEVDALVRSQNERLRAGLEEARRRRVRAVVSAMERAAARRLRAAEAELERALGRNAELDEKLRQTRAEGQAWEGVAKSHETTAAGLRATLERLLQSPWAGASGAEDAQSCCFEQDRGGRACKSCGEADACVLLLPCRHLCLCGGCESAADACPVCAATKNASLHVLLS